ncbi:hypothetical protein ATN88_21760 [Enterovibrio coralii]|uniref:Uncharacterized protein n=1 Tax=Enterovibrio coralii TaxID=294935 RepID=A0A135I6E3_9GAMM|nr:hypothetical protein ATN88_21760 [Enterovibrio coralii]
MLRNECESKHDGSTGQGKTKGHLQDGELRTSLKESATNQGNDAGSTFRSWIAASKTSRARR